MLVCVCRFAPSVWTWGRTCLWVPWVRTSCWRSSPPYPEPAGPLTFTLTHLRLLHVTPVRTGFDLQAVLLVQCVWVRSHSELTRIGLTKQSDKFAQCEFWFWLPGIFLSFIGGPVLFLLILLHIFHCLSTRMMKANVLAQNYQQFSVLFYIQSECKQKKSYFHEHRKEMSGSRIKENYNLH